ncbi:ArsR/SmtB family transcription factor [Limisphaera sp. 4302-co]|uniref:ArsR/SmtB family transcription factor n=1 Tax=Limisphaera sp. 4302-co TaxID=3400417 RepID=UPI003C1E39E7
MSDAARLRPWKEPARVFKALGHPGRLLIVEELARGERCVCELAALLGVRMPTVSRHLALLRQAGIVEDEKRGPQVFYRLRTPCVLRFFECLAAVQEETPGTTSGVAPRQKTGAASGPPPASPSQGNGQTHPSRRRKAHA